MNRFFYHFRKQTKDMTVHFKGRCVRASNVVCKVPCESKWNSRQPMLVMQGFANRIHRGADGTVTID